jgi:hypothetical protein
MRSAEACAPVGSRHFTAGLQSGGRWLAALRLCTKMMVHNGNAHCSADGRRLWYAPKWWPAQQLRYGRKGASGRSTPFLWRVPRPRPSERRREASRSWASVSCSKVLWKSPYVSAAAHDIALLLAHTGFVVPLQQWSAKHWRARLPAAAQLRVLAPGPSYGARWANSVMRRRPASSPRQLAPRRQQRGTSERSSCLQSGHLVRGALATALTAHRGCPCSS